MELEGYEEFLKLRRQVMGKIAKVDLSSGHKSLEGLFDISISYSDYFDELDAGQTIDNPNFVKITLYCYTLGPGRSYEWRGNSISEAVDKARKEIESWVDQYG